MKEDAWIDIPNWGRFQHYGTARRPTWIKTYTELLTKDEYLTLSLSARGLLHTTWLAFAMTNGQLRVSTVNQYCASCAREKHWQALNHAGLVVLCASKPLPLNKREEVHETNRWNTAPVDPRRRAALNWINNGAAEHVPQSQLEDVLTEDFKITDPAMLADLLAQAQEHLALDRP